MLAERHEIKQDGRWLVKLALLLAAVSFAGPVARAEIVNNFGPLVDPGLSRNASSTLTSGATIVMSAITMAESGEREKATAQVKNGIATLNKSRMLFSEIQKVLGSSPIDINKAGLPKAQIEQIAQRYKIEMPKTTDALVKLAIAELDRFLSTAQEMSFDNVQKARAGTLSFASGINRLLEIGVMVSSLADGGSTEKK
jgi:hypothetical protein